MLYLVGALLWALYLWLDRHDLLADPDFLQLVEERGRASAIKSAFATSLLCVVIWPVMLWILLFQWIRRQMSI